MIEVDEIPCFSSQPYIKQLQQDSNSPIQTSTFSSSLLQKSQRIEMASHTRSNSFPSRAHPIIEEVNELCRLRSSASTSTSSSSISNKLTGLQDLHECVERLLQSPLNQQALAHEKNQDCTNELLDGSLRLLDICSIAKDVLLQNKASVHDLQSIIRRRGCESGVLMTEVKKYLTSRKMVKKTIQKAMLNTKSTFSSLNKETKSISIVNTLRDVEAITLAVFDSLLSFISGPKASTNWSLVSKMMQSKKIACEEEKAAINEFAEVDAALKSIKSADNVQNQLSNLESCIQDQEGLECLFRQLIKTRVSLLNILNH